MLTRRAALEAVAFAIAISVFSSILHADEPARRWRPATAADLPAGTVIQPAASGDGAAALPAAGAGVRVHIDPATGNLMQAPAESTAEAEAAAHIDAGAAPLVLKKSPSGLLYVDTSDYRHTATVSLDTQSQPKLDCEDPPQDAAAAARLAGKTPVHTAHSPPAPAASSAGHDSTGHDSGATSAQLAADRTAARLAAQQQRLTAIGGSAAPAADVASAIPPTRTHQATPAPTTTTPASAAAPSTASEQ